jgi:hypothetical protein
LKSVALQQIRDLLRDDPVLDRALPSLKITRQIDGGRRWIDEEVELTLLKTGDYQAVIDEIMERAGRAEREGTAISLGHEKGVGVTVNCRKPNALTCLLIAKLPSRKFGLYINAPAKIVAAKPGQETATVRQEPARNPIDECRRWLADYQRRADIAGAKYDDIPEYIKCIKEAGALGTPEAMKVLQEVRTGAMFTNILEAAVAAMDQAKFGNEGPLNKCGRYLAQQEAWATSFSGKAVEDWEFGKCFKELKALNTPAATDMLRKVAETDCVFPGARDAARAALGQEVKKRTATDGGTGGGSPDFGGDVDRFLAEAKTILERLPVCDRGVVLEQFCRGHHELSKPREAANSAEVIQFAREWANLNKGRPSFKKFRIQWQLNPLRADGGVVELVAFHEGQQGPYFTGCQSKPARDRWYFWY